jgi:mxaA protein
MISQRTKALLLLMAICQIAIAQPAAVDNELNVNVRMRDSGYTMGDYIKMHVEIPTHTKLSIDPESLPLIGRVKPWLDLQDLKLNTQKDNLSLDFTWQVFATVEITQTLKTPQIQLKTLENPKHTINIPAQSFYYSPVLPYPIGEVKRHHNIPPPQFDVQTPLTKMGISLTIATMLCVFLLWLKDLIPWLPYQPGPITTLARQLRGLRNDTLQYDELQKVHHALNSAAKQSLYPNTLDILFKKAPYLKNERDAIHQFFNDSWSNIYESPSYTHPITVAQTLAWVNRAAVAERIFRNRSIAKAVHKRT